MTVNGLSGVFANQSFPADREPLVFGRNTSACNILFPDNVKGISRMHCKIEQNGANYTITDLGSSYGTFVNGMKIQSYTPKLLRNGDTFYLGDKANMFSFQNPNEVMSAGPAYNANSVTYVNRGNAGNNKNNNSTIIIIAVATLVICVIGAIAFSYVKKSEAARVQAEQELYNEQNKGFGGELFDALESGIKWYFD